MKHIMDYPEPRTQYILTDAYVRRLGATPLRDWTKFDRMMMWLGNSEGFAQLRDKARMEGIPGFSVDYGSPV